MKMKIRERLLVALYALLGLCGLAALGALVFKPDILTRIGDKLREAWSDSLMRVIICLIALLLLAWTIRVFLMAFKREPKHDKGSVAVQNTENGAVRVSVQAMDALVRQAIGGADGVLDIKSKIINHEDSVSVKIEMTLAGDAHIPNVTMLLQRNIKSFIEEYSGIAVRDVSVLVNSIVPSTAPKAIAEKSQVAEENKPEIVVEPEPVSQTVEEDIQEEEPLAEEEPQEEEVQAEEEPAQESEMEDAPSFEPSAEEDAQSCEADAEEETLSSETEAEEDVSYEAVNEEGEPLTDEAETEEETKQSWREEE